MRPSYRYMTMRGLGDGDAVDCNAPGYTGDYTNCTDASDNNTTGNSSANNTTVTPPAWGTLLTDFGSLTGLNSQANTGGADYSSTQQMATGSVPGQPAPGASAAPGGSPASGANPDAAGSWSNFFDADSCGTNFCINDLFDPSQPYLWVWVAGLAGLMILGSRK